MVTKDELMQELKDIEYDDEMQSYIKKVAYKIAREEQKKSEKRYSVIFKIEEDADTIEAIEASSNKSAFLKNAIRFYIEHQE